MATTLFKGNPVRTAGSLPAPGANPGDLAFVANDLSVVSLRAFAGKKVVLSVFPSIDTGVCAASVRRFNREAAAHADAEILNVSMDLPFAQKRFCGAEGIDRVRTLSAFRHPETAAALGLLMTDGPLQGLFARAVLVLDEKGTVRHAELVPEITTEPDYAKALAALA